MRICYLLTSNLNRLVYLTPIIASWIRSFRKDGPKISQSLNKQHMSYSSGTASIRKTWRSRITARTSSSTGLPICPNHKNWETKPFTMLARPSTATSTVCSILKATTKASRASSSMQRSDLFKLKVGGLTEKMLTAVSKNLGWKYSNWNQERWLNNVNKRSSHRPELCHKMQRSSKAPGLRGPPRLTQKKLILWLIGKT